MLRFLFFWFLQNASQQCALFALLLRVFVLLSLGAFHAPAAHCTAACCEHAELIRMLCFVGCTPSATIPS